MECHMVCPRSFQDETSCIVLKSVQRVVAAPRERGIKRASRVRPKAETNVYVP